MMNQSAISKGNYQAGAILVVSLILLLVMSLVGVAAMNGARQEIAMAAATQQEELALRRAERTLLAAEAEVRDIVKATGAHSFSGNGYYLASNNQAPDISLSMDPNSLAVRDGIQDGDFYVIEYLGEKVVPGESEGVETDASVEGGIVHAYRITVRSDTDGRGVRTIRSIYTTSAAP